MSLPVVVATHHVIQQHSYSQRRRQIGSYLLDCGAGCVFGCLADIAICVLAVANGYNRPSSRILDLLLASFHLQVRQELQRFGSVGT